MYQCLWCYNLSYLDQWVEVPGLWSFFMSQIKYSQYWFKSFHYILIPTNIWNFCLISVLECIRFLIITIPFIYEFKEFETLNRLLSYGVGGWWWWPFWFNCQPKSKPLRHKTWDLWFRLQLDNFYIQGFGLYCFTLFMPKIKNQNSFITSLQSAWL